MNRDSSLSARPFAAADHDEPHVFHSSLRLFALVEAKPRPGCPDWGEVACIPHRGDEYLMTYLSPVDARIERRSRNRSGHFYQVHPFVAVHPGHFLQTHQWRLNVAVTYGFAAHQGRLIVDRLSGLPLPLILSKRFQIAPATGVKFHLSFGNMHDVLASIYSTVGLPNYAESLDEMNTSPAVALDKIAVKALSRIESPLHGEGATEFGVYDSAQRCWKFADLDRLRPHGSA